MTSKASQPASHRPGILHPLNDAWTFIRPVTSTRRSTRATAKDISPNEPAPELPSFLASAEFAVLDHGEVRATPGRRSAGVSTTSSLQLASEVNADAVVFLAARQASGALSFHLPQRSPARRGAPAPSQMVVVFDIPVSDGTGETGRRGLISTAVRVILVKVVDAVVGELTKHAAEWAVPFLARKLEEHLWQERTQGWLRVTPEGLSSGESRLSAAKPTFPRSQRGLLLIHGTFSSAEGGFKKLTQTDFFAQARSLYGENIFAFNHFTISKTPEDNVKDLLDALPDQDFEFDIITHSRGGLVARELLERSGRQHPKGSHLKIGRVIMVACPGAGTPLGSPAHWDNKLSFFANLLELLPDNPFTTAGAWLAESLKWIAANVLGNCEGLVAMDPGGAYIAELQLPPDAPAGTAYHAVVSNFHPPREWWARLADMGADKFFDGANDLVVPTEGGWKTSDTPSAWIPGGQIACLGPGGNLRPDTGPILNHLDFFGDPDVVGFLLACLRGQPNNLPALATDRLLPSRDFRLVRGMVPAGDTAQNLSAPSPAPAPEPVNDAEPLTVTATTSGWDSEEELRLTVVSSERNARVDQESGSTVPLLMAQYGSARVAVPFYTRGTDDDAGKRWHRIIGCHRQLVSYANGGAFCSQPGADGKDYPDDGFLKALGGDLFRTLFPGSVRNLYNVARFMHKKRRLKIVFSSMIPWVADFPWELAYDSESDCFLSCGDVRFVRNVLTPTPANKIAEKDGALRILVVSAQPAGAGQLSIEEERRSIHESFRPLIDAGLVHVEVLAGATPSLLHERLRYQMPDDDFDVLHFIGHGEFDETTGTGYLLFQDEAGRAKPLTSASFLNILRGRDIRLVFLNACETGRGQKADYNRGVAMALVKDGLPAVVANQYSVIDRSASLFSLHFYACLAKGLRIGDAMREARIALQYNGVEPMDWAVPVLFANNADARLCRSPARTLSSDASEAESFGVLSGSARSRRRLTGPRRKTIAVWDAENALVYRENLQATLDELNQVQESFAFQLERFTAPRGLWEVDANHPDDGVAYLRAENVINRMERIRTAIGADYLFCVTDLPLCSDDTAAIYYFVDKKTAIFSTWELKPRLTGRLLQKAIANHLALYLLEDLSGVHSGARRDDDPRHPIHTVGFWNDRRSVAHIAGPMSITPRTAAELKRAIRPDKFTQQQFDAIKTLLNMYR